MVYFFTVLGFILTALALQGLRIVDFSTILEGLGWRMRSFTSHNVSHNFAILVIGLALIFGLD